MKLEDKILKFLKQGKKPQAEIATALGINYYKTISLLNELKEKGKVKRIKKKTYTYWELN